MLNQRSNLSELKKYTAEKSKKVKHLKKRVHDYKYFQLQKAFKDFNIFGSPMKLLNYPHSYESLFFSIGLKEFRLDRFTEIMSAKDEWEHV